MDRAVDRCVSEVGRELEQAQTELVNAGLSGSGEGLSRIVTEIARGVMTRTIKAHIDVTSRSVVADFTQALGDLGKVMGTFNNEQNWLGDLSDKINRSLQKTGETLGHWNGSLAEHNTREMERLKVDTGWKDGQPLPKVTYRALATVLAVTTGVVAPLIELAIIFLPDILAFINEGNQKNKLRQKILNEVIPSYKRELRDKLPPLLKEQLDSMVAQISAEFEREIGEKQKVIDELVASSDQNSQVTEQQILRLEQVRKDIQRLAKSALYGTVQL
jgi:methyl-accepting chemotaxis protein